MASTDYPFSVTSKFISQDGAEHLVTVRAATVKDFAVRLTEAATVFPYAGFGQGVQVDPSTGVVPEAAAPTEDVETVKARLRETARAQEQAATRRAQERAATGRNGNAPHCPVHHRRMSPSRWGGYYCTAKLGDQDADGGQAYCSEKATA